MRTPVRRRLTLGGRAGIVGILLLGAPIDSIGKWIVRVPKGRFSKSILDAIGYTYDEIDRSNMRFSGEGLWVGISRDPVTGILRAASHNRNNSAAVAW